MQMKLKSGKMVDLSDDELKEIMEMHKAEFDGNKMKHYFHEMYKKAHANIEMISEEDIESEKDLKEALQKVLKHGSYEEVSDMIIEAIECKISKMVLESFEE